ncbi:MAG: electron transfer flavoprotein subunit alpha/FixB family protein, partial [Nocardioidaceae bacterium]
MAEILVLADHDGGEAAKVTFELITLARRFGEPAVAWAGPGAEQGLQSCAEYGAARVYAAGDPAFDDLVVAPVAALLAQLVRDTNPALVLISGSPEGKEIAARLAVRTDSGLITDATDL